MAETWTIKGPFRIVEHSWEYTSVYDADNKPVCTIQIDDEVTEETQDHFEKITEAKARAIASLPALIEAAEPFERWLSDLDPEFSDHEDDIIVAGRGENVITFGHLRSLREALSSIKGGK